MILGQPMSVVREHSIVEVMVLSEASRAAETLRMVDAIGFALGDSAEVGSALNELRRAAQ